MKLARIRRWVVRQFAPKQPLARELFYLRRSIRHTDRQIEEIYSSDLGSGCCYNCEFPALCDLEDRLERQLLRRDQLEMRGTT